MFCVTVIEDRSHQKEKKGEDLADHLLLKEISSRYRVLSTLEFECHLTVSYKMLSGTCQTQVLNSKKKCPSLVLHFWDNSGLIIQLAERKHTFICFYIIQTLVSESEDICSTGTFVLQVHSAFQAS